MRFVNTYTTWVAGATVFSPTRGSPFFSRRIRSTFPARWLRLSTLKNTAPEHDRKSVRISQLIARSSSRELHRVARQLGFGVRRSNLLEQLYIQRLYSLARLINKIRDDHTRIIDDHAIKVTNFSLSSFFSLLIRDIGRAIKFNTMWARASVCSALLVSLSTILPLDFEPEENKSRVSTDFINSPRGNGRWYRVPYRLSILSV